MSLLIFSLLVIIALIIVWAIISSAPLGDARLKWALQAITGVIAIIAILQRAGVV